jgi:hypothetical protein
MKFLIHPTTSLSHRLRAWSFQISAPASRSLLLLLLLLLILPLPFRTMVTICFLGISQLKYFPKKSQRAIIPVSAPAAPGETQRESIPVLISSRNYHLFHGQH